MTGTALPTPTSRFKLILLQLVVLYLLGLRLWFDITVTPMGDEAYYWMWGQHLSWSYFDHPPLNGWLQGAVAAIFGWSNFTVRLTTWLSLAGTASVFWLWSARLAPHDRAGWFWHTLAIFLTIPTIAILGGVAFHDHLLVFFALASLYAFHRFADAWEDGDPAWRWLYLSAALLGLATLTKYNGVFLGIAYALWVLIRPKLRPLLLTPHLWLAALLAIAIQAPVFHWNLGAGMASFQFHLADRPSANWARPRTGQITTFLATVPIALSPVLALAAFRLFWIKPRSPSEGRIFGLAGTAYFSALILWAGLAAYVTVYFHWNIVGYAMLAPVAWRLIGGRFFLWLHVLFGLFVASVAVLSYTVTPLKIGGIGDPGAPANYGWPEVATRIEALQADHPGSFLGATRYTYAAQLGFQLHDTEIAAFNPVRSQNDYWWDAAARTGQDALIVADRQFTIDAARDSFATLEQLDTVDAVDRDGKVLWRFEIWLARDFQPRPR
ncbi:MAG: phospholipid carrier-dependent glycosyltransferase [Hyphomicrobiales bacterium]|nr:MAG: phospholipid carrier-dependent glycosyltransferase [Hyphomicrobiales bacterium]